MRGAAITALFLATGCSVPLVNVAPPEQQNQCSSDKDCSGGAVCDGLAGGAACVSTQVDLPGLLLEVIPPTGAAFGAGTSFLPAGTFGLDQPAAGGVVRSVDIALEPLVSITGSIKLGYDFAPCGLATGSTMPALIAFHRIPPYLGLEDTVYSNASPTGAGPVEVQVPPGTYDIYVQPQVPPSCMAAPPPPFFTASYELNGNVGFNLTLGPPSVLNGQLRVPAQGSIDGWALELVSQKTGQLVSDSLTLSDPVAGDSIPIQNLSYTLGNDPSTPPFIRLRPKAGVVAPTVYWDLGAVELAGGMSAPLTVANLPIGGSPADKPCTSPGAARCVQAYVQDENDQPVVASVQIRSTSFLVPGLGTNATYSVTTQTDDTGYFSVDLPPGEYDFTALPTADATKALGHQSMTVGPGSSCFCGQVILAPPRRTLEGTALTPGGAPLVSAVVFANPSFAEPQSFATSQLNVAPVQPRQASSTPDRSGFFSLQVDQSPYDLSVRPSDGSLYPWLVQPRAQSSSAEAKPWNLGTLTLPSPAILTGTLTDPSGNPVSGAMVNAWLPVTDASNKPTGTVIQVGSTLADDNGGYTLPLPPSIAQ